mgnify:CR=1 FL=1
MINPNKHAVSYEEYVYNAPTWDEDYSTLYLLENGKYPSLEDYFGSFNNSNVGIDNVLQYMDNCNSLTFFYHD